MCNEVRTCMKRSKHLPVHKTDYWVNKKMKILRQKIVALKKNKMNAGNLGFFKEWEYKNFVLQVWDLFWFKTFLDIMNNLSSNYLSLVAYSGNSRIMTHVYLIFVFHPEPFHLSRNPMCIIQLFIFSPAT